MKAHADQQEVTDVLLYLSRFEAAELRDALNTLIEYFDEPGWHAHVSSSDYQIEITVAPETD